MFWSRHIEKIFKELFNRKFMAKQEEYVILSGRQMQKLRKNVLHRYHDLGEKVYHTEELNELFSGTGIPNEIINEELGNLKSRSALVPMINPQYKTLKVRKKTKKSKKKGDLTFVDQYPHGYLLLQSCQKKQKDIKKWLEY
jgi:hypothetical protein